MVYRRGGKRKQSSRPRKMNRRQRKIKYPDGLNVKLQHNDITIASVAGTSAPFASGAGVITTTIPGASYNGIAFNDITGAMLFRLRDSLQWNQFNTLYDRVKLNGVKIQFIPQWSQGFATSSAASPYNQTALIPTMKIVHDYDDANPPQTINSVWARRGRVFRLNRPFSLFIKPRIRTAVYNAPQGGGSSIIPGLSTKATYMDVASCADVAHYGLKFGIKDWDGNANLQLQVVITYYCSFKNMLYNAAPVKGEDTIEVVDLVDEELLPCEDQPPPEPKE